MISLDLILGGIILAFAGIGALRGWVSEGLSLAVWILAGAIAWFFAEDAAPWFARDIIDEQGRRILGFVALFIVSFFALTFATFVLRIAMLSPMTNVWSRMLGGLLGAARGMAVASILVGLAGLTPMPKESWWGESELAPPLESLTLALVSHLPSGITSQLRY